MKSHNHFLLPKILSILINNNQNSDAIEQIKDRIDIVDIVSEHVALKKSGRNFWGCCPFHKEKTPSFSVNPEKGIFKCFGCGAGGDAISFLMKRNNTNFMETITELAAKYGIELPSFGFSSDKTELKQKIFDANKQASKFFTENLLTLDEAKQAREYLFNRGLSEESIIEFGLGFAKNQYDSLMSHMLKNKKTDLELLNNAGLVVERSNKKGYYDRFRNRVIIPIINEKGDVVAFGARALGDDQNPKYLNSPETPVFNKSKTLYGMYHAKDAIKNEDNVLIMEGYFDVITAQANGIRNAVATCGTALTEQHLKILSRYTLSKKIYLAFDTDKAGQQATERGSEIIKETFSGLGNIKQFDESFSKNSLKNNSVCEIRVVTTESGKDPDDFIRSEGADSYKRCINQAPLLIDHQINSIIKSTKEINTPQEKLNVSKKIIPILAEISNRIILDEYIKLVSQRLDMEQNSLRKEIENIQNGIFNTRQEKSHIVKKSLKKHEKAQKNLLSLYFIDSEKLSFSCINEMLKEVDFTEADLIILKQTIEQISNEVTTNKELSDKLMTTFSDNPEIKELLVDIIYSIDDKIDLLNSEYINPYIEENINCIHQYLKLEQQEQLKSKYRTANKDEISSLELQYQVREQVKLIGQRMELINDKTKRQ